MRDADTIALCAERLDGFSGWICFCLHDLVI
jgi:hypothetical protein